MRRPAPRWLHAPAARGRRRQFAVRARGLSAAVPVRIWSPADADVRESLPLLVAHDGPDYDRQASLTRFCAAAIHAGELPRHRVALLAAARREEWYSASTLYARALCGEVLAALRGAVAVAGAPVGMGASLGALAMLHAQRSHPGSFRALFLQSGSFFVPRWDRHESGFRRYGRIVRWVRATLRAPAHPDSVAATLTCGAAEENLPNNRLMARALAAQGYRAILHEVRGAHDYAAWRDAFDPHLTELLADAWSR